LLVAVALAGLLLAALLLVRFRTAGPIVVSRSPLLDRAAPAIELRDLEDRPVSLAAYRGRPVIVHFWASWCIPCRTEFPLYKRVRAEHAAEGLEVLGIIYDDSVEAAAGFYQVQGADWPAMEDPGGLVAAQWRVVGLPITYFVDRQGIVRGVSYGPPPPDALDTLLRRIL
jgi:cytochrome c biogenesis protein CcmG/thiol:disulfide interchange protein DsbE